MFNPSLLRIALLWGCLGAQCFAQQIVNGFSSPTGITSDGKRYFISNQEYQKSSGFISEVSENGTMIRLKLFPQTGHLKSPKGPYTFHNAQDAYMDVTKRNLKCNFNNFPISLGDYKTVNM